MPGTSGPDRPAAPQPVLLMARELHHGGSERQLTETALGLDRSRFMPHVAAFRPHGLRADQLRAAGIPLLHLPVYSFRSPQALACAWQLRGYIRRHGIRLVHAFDSPTAVWATPVVRFLTGAVAVSSQRGHRDLLPELRRLLRWTDRLVHGIVVNCDFIKAHLKEDERVPEHRVYVCRNGLDLETFRPGPARRPPVLPEGALVIGTVCVLRPEKGIETLIDGFAGLRPFPRPLKLAIVGSGPSLSRLQARAREAGVFDDCVWQATTPDVVPWLRSFDVFVLPSLSEASSNSLMEAMACGSPVVASKAGGNPELVEPGERGLLFAPGDAKALAAALRVLLADEPLRHRLADAGTRFIQEGFSRHAAAARMAGIYERILSRTG